MAHEQHEYEVIVINGERFPCAPVIGYNQTATFEPKRTDGDYTRDSDQIFSAKIWTSFEGGIGVENHREGVDEGRCWFGTLFMEKPFQICLLPKVYSYTGAQWVLGDHLGEMYAQKDDGSLMVWDEVNFTWDDTTANIDQDPVNPATSFGASLYIPHGPNGYSIFTPASTESLNAGRQPVDFIVWDNRLFQIGDNGVFSYTTDGTTWTDVLTLPSHIEPKSLSIYFDRSDNEVIMLAANDGLYTYDPTTDAFRRSQFRLPPHPDNGLGMDVWRPGEDLYVSAGLEVYRYTGAATVPMGPDRSEGVPAQFRGRFVDLCSSHNELNGLLAGVSTSSEVDPDVLFDPGIGMDEEFEISVATALSSMFVWNGVGWHPKWTSDDDTGIPTWIVTSAANGEYRVWWGYGTDTTYTIPLSRSFSNPRARWQTAEIEFEDSGFIDTGWVDHNMREFDKLASHVEVNMESATDDEFVEIFYRKDFENDWTSLGMATTSGKTVLPFNIEAQSDGTEFGRGMVYRRIRFKVEMSRGADESQSPFMDSFSLKYIKIPQKAAYFTITIPLEFEEQWEGKSKDYIRHQIEDLLVDDGFVRIQYGSDEHRPSRRVRISRFSAPVQTGLNALTNITISAIEVPLEGYDGNEAA